MRVIRCTVRVISTLLTALLALVLLCNLYMIGAKSFLGIRNPSVFGYCWAVVVSGSMSGSIEVDDMVIIHRQDEYAPGDVISFESGRSLVTHRIVEETNDGFITKGDANNAADLEPVTQDRIVGRVVCVIPGVGAIIEGIRTPMGMMSIMLMGVLMIAVPSLLGREDE